MLIKKDNTGSKPSHETIANPRNPRREIDIEYLLHWVYQDQQADAVNSHPRGPMGVRSNMITIQNNGRLGTLVDCRGSGMWAVGALHPDAEAVHDLVMALPPYEAGFVYEYAKSGLRPDCFVGQVSRPVPLLRSNGKVKLEYADDDYRKPVLCLLRYNPDPTEVELMREVYSVWHGALTRLQASIGDLSDYLVTGPALPEKPWLEKKVDRRGKT